MSDEQRYGVYYSVRTPNGHLWSSTRATQEEVLADLTAAFGEEYAEAVVADIKSMAVLYGANGVGEGHVIPFPQQQQMEEAAIEAVAAAFDDSPTVAEQVPSFETCVKCGSPKSKWVPAGVSKRTQRPYPGFFGCSNGSCR